MKTKSTTTTSTHSLSSSTTTGGSTDRIRQQEWKILLQDYEQKVNSPTPYIAQQLLYWYNRLDINAVSYAITETAGAPRPSWAYCSAVLTRVSRDFSAGRNYKSFNDSYHITPRLLKIQTEEMERKMKENGEL